MPLPVKLSEIVDEMDIQTDLFSSHLNKKTGQLTVVSAEEMEYAEYEDDEIPDYVHLEEDSPEVARSILETDDYIQLPTHYEIHEYRIMEQFCFSVGDEALRDKLYSSIQGRGAFRRFKDKIYEHGIEEDWFRYRREAFKKIAIDWCQRNNIPYVDE